MMFSFQAMPRAGEGSSAWGGFHSKAYAHGRRGRGVPGSLDGCTVRFPLPLYRPRAATDSEFTINSY